MAVGVDWVASPMLAPPAITPSEQLHARAVSPYGHWMRTSAHHRLPPRRQPAIGCAADKRPKAANNGQTSESITPPASRNSRRTAKKATRAANDATKSTPMTRPAHRPLSNSPEQRSQPVGNGTGDRSEHLRTKDRVPEITPRVRPSNNGGLELLERDCIAEAWRPKGGGNPCPWATTDHSAVANVTLRLSKEITDFYHHVSPGPVERRVRHHLISSLNKAMRRDAGIFGSAVGSVASGMYLPAADVDLRVFSTSYGYHGVPRFTSSKYPLYEFGRMLIAQGLAHTHTIEVIPHARVPLIKYVDQLTGLPVDVSFKSAGGPQSVQQIVQWGREFPALPIMVLVIKQFLLMRGLNKPSNGGIGGLSVTCLVVSFLRHVASADRRSASGLGLGEILLEFFRFYGHLFCYESYAVCPAGPVSYVSKSSIRDISLRHPGRLCIIDPEDPCNNISSTSSKTSGIKACFARAYTSLANRMKRLAITHEAGSTLEVILGGDYSSFHSQRDWLRYVHERYVGPCDG